MESGNVLLSRAFAPGSPFVHRASPTVHLVKDNVAHWLEMIRMGRAFPVLCTRKRTQQMLSPFSCGIRQRPTLPGRLQPSTIGAERLNFCVRYGNRWIPFAIVTGMLSRVCAVLRLLGFRDVHCKPSLLSWRRSAHLALLSSIARTLKTAHPDFFPSCLHQFLPCLLASISS